MKKLLNILIICTLVSVFCSTSTSTAKSNDDVDFLLIPYEKVLNKLSEEYGVGMYIPEKNKEKFLNSMKNISPKEFEKQLRQQYKESQQYINEDAYDNGDYKSLYPNTMPNTDTNIPPMNPINE